VKIVLRIFNALNCVLGAIDYIDAVFIRMLQPLVSRLYASVHLSNYVIAACFFAVTTCCLCYFTFGEFEQRRTDGAIYMLIAGGFVVDALRRAVVEKESQRFNHTHAFFRPIVLGIGILLCLMTIPEFNERLALIDISAAAFVLGWYAEACETPVRRQTK
jgi:hypothetical protein